MDAMRIKLRSFQELEEFVNVCSKFKGCVMISNGTSSLNGKAFLGVCSLDHSQGVYVKIYEEDCTEEDLCNLKNSLRKFQENDKEI